MMDWQNVAVVLVVAAALLYVARRGLSRLRSFGAGRGGGASCATGCGKCGEETGPPVPAGSVLVQIKRAGDSQQRR
jgi:hypothetical protein